MILCLAATLAASSASRIQMSRVMPQPFHASTDAPSIEYGYCGDLEGTIGWDAAGTIRAVIEIPTEIAIKYQGAKITQVLAGLGNDAGSNAKVIIFNSLSDTDLLYSQDVTFVADRWNTVELATPFTLNGKAIYIGYELTVTDSKTYPVGIDHQKAVPQGDLCSMQNPDTKEWVWEHLADYGFGNNCIKVVMEGDNLPKYDLALTNVVIQEYVHTGEGFSIRGTVENKAGLDAETFNIAYQIGNGEPVVSKINTLVAKSSTAEFSIDNITIAEDGSYDIKIEITEVAGHPDEDISNNTLSKTVHSLSNMPKRKILIEEFSTAQCGNCPRAHQIMKNITDGRNDISLVLHHAGFGQDSYTIAASRSYLDFYNGNTYAPAMMIDRRNLSEQGAPGYMGVAAGPVFAVTTQEEVEKFINYCFEQPAVVDVNIEKVYNEETRELSVRVFGETVIDLPKTPFINIFLSESGLVNYQAGGGNDYIHNHAIRATMTDTWGDALTITDRKFDVTYTTTLNSKWVAQNMDIIAFVADYNSRNIDACTVYNSDWKHLIGDSGVDVVVDNGCSVWASNGNIYISGAYNDAEIYSIDGRLIKHIRGNNCIEMHNKGIYLVKVDGKTAVKVIVK